MAIRHQYGGTAGILSAYGAGQAERQRSDREYARQVMLQQQRLAAQALLQQQRLAGARGQGRRRAAAGRVINPLADGRALGLGEAKPPAGGAIGGIPGVTGVLPSAIPGVTAPAGGATGFPDVSAEDIYASDERLRRGASGPPRSSYYSTPRPIEPGSVGGAAARATSDHPGTRNYYSTPRPLPPPLPESIKESYEFAEGDDPSGYLENLRRVDAEGDFEPTFSPEEWAAYDEHVKRGRPISDAEAAAAEEARARLWNSPDAVAKRKAWADEIARRRGAVRGSGGPVGGGAAAAYGAAPGAPAAGGFPAAYGAAAPAGIPATPALLVQQRAQIKRAARKQRLGKPLSPEESNLLPRYQSPEEVAYQMEELERQREIAEKRRVEQLALDKEKRGRAAAIEDRDISRSDKFYSPLVQGYGTDLDKISEIAAGRPFTPGFQKTLDEAMRDYEHIMDPDNPTVSGPEERYQALTKSKAIRKALKFNEKRDLMRDPEEEKQIREEARKVQEDYDKRLDDYETTKQRVFTDELKRLLALKDSDNTPIHSAEDARREAAKVRDAWAAEYPPPVRFTSAPPTLPAPQFSPLDATEGLPGSAPAFPGFEPPPAPVPRPAPRQPAAAPVQQRPAPAEAAATPEQTPARGGGFDLGNLQPEVEDFGGGMSRRPEVQIEMASSRLKELQKKYPKGGKTMSIKEAREYQRLRQLISQMQAYVPGG